MHTKSAKNGLERDLVNEKQNKKVRPGPGARLGERRKPQKNELEHDLVHEENHKNKTRFGARSKTQNNTNWSTIWCTRKNHKARTRVRFGAQKE